MATSCLCCKCHCTIIFPDGVEDRLRQTKAEFFCLNGHPQAFYGQTQIEKERDALRRQLADAQAAKERAETQSNAAVREMKLSKNACKACSRRFETQEALTRHVRRIHQNGPKRLPGEGGRVELILTIVHRRARR